MVATEVEQIRGSDLDEVLEYRRTGGRGLRRGDSRLQQCDVTHSIDTASIDYGQSTLFESHRILYERNIPAFENLAALDQLPARGAVVYALPVKIKGGSGAPLRAIAVLPPS